MSVNEKVQKIMNQDKTRKKIMRMAKKNNVSFDIAKTMFESTIKEMIKVEDFWKNFKVKPN